MAGESGQHAPERLEVIRAFVNTKNIEEGYDMLASPRLLHAWLADRGLLRDEESLSEAELQKMLEFRELIRVLLLINNGVEPDQGTLDKLNQITQDAGVIMQCHRGRQGPVELHIEPERAGIDGAIGRLMGIIFTAMIDGTWTRLKACHNDECHWAFYDASKNRSGIWCSMAICGSRFKARSYRERHQLTTFS